MLIDVVAFKDVFGGNVYFDKGKNGYDKWSIQARTDVELFKSYLIFFLFFSLILFFPLMEKKRINEKKRKYPYFSNKKQRLYLTNTYYCLKDLKAYSALPNNPLAKAWLKFNNKWKSRG